MSEILDRVEAASDSAAMDPREFGKASVESAQGFTPMPEVSKPEPEVDTSAPPKAWERPDDWRRQGPELTPVQYNRIDSSGRRTDERSDERLTLTPERAARDLSQHRRGLQETADALRDLELQDQVEKLKSPLRAAVNEAEADGEAAAEALKYESQAQQQNEQQQQEQPQSAEGDPVRRALEDPRVLSAVMEQRQRDLAEGQRAIDNAYTAVQQSAAMARAAIFSRHPEIANLAPDQLQVALNVLAQSNPEKYNAIRADYEAAQGLLQTAAQAQAQRQQVDAQHAAAQFQAWSKAQDDAFDAELGKQPPERQAAIRQEARAMLKDYGLSDQDVAFLWQNDIAFRSHAGQRILADAAAFRLQQKTAQSIKPVPPTLPRVQRPGSSATRMERGEDVDLRNLNSRLNTSHSAKDAAALLAARRARSR
jgi:hypothetical protein